MAAIIDMAAPVHPGAATALTLRTDTAGNPVVSGTFVLQRPPRPDERLGPLVQHGTLAFEVSVVDLDVPDPVEELTVELRDGAEVLATGSASGPFLHAGLQADLDATRAQHALLAMLGDATPLAVRARIRLRTAPATPTKVELDVDAAWRVLDAAADVSRSFLVVDLDNYLQAFLDTGVLRVLAGPDDVARIRPAFLRAMRPVLDDDLVLAVAGTGPLTVTTTAPAAPAQEPRLVEVDAPLTDLLAPTVTSDPTRFMHLLGQVDGRLVDVPPVRGGRGTRAGRVDTGLHVLAAGRVVGLAAALRPEEPVRPLPIRPEALALAQDRPQIHAIGTLVVAEPTDHRPGPLVGRVDAPLWMDRWDAATAWYLPVFRMVTPEPTQRADEAPFRYELRPDVGHRTDGTAGMVATITVRLQPEQSEATRAALEATDYTTVTPVPITAMTVQLAVPFRDTSGVARVETITADSVQPEGALGADGTSVVATFRLLDDWARTAYGALSTPAFQAQPAAVAVSASFEGWSEQNRRPHVLGLDKRWALTGFPTRDAAPVRPTAALLATPLGLASIRPAWQFRPELLDRLDATTYSWRQFSGASSTEAFVPCTEFGQLYREWREDTWHDIGCQPALQLGTVEYKTHEPVAVAAAEPFAAVYRSLQSPGRFLVVPRTYAVGRYGPGAGERAYRPRMLLHSSVDDEDPTDIRCVLAASLEPVLPPYVRSAITAELRATRHPDPVVEYLYDVGVTIDTRWAVPGQTDLSCIPTPSGFDVVLTTDLAGFLAVRSMIERDGLNGVAAAAMPGGVRASAALKIGLADVTGPFEGGPVELRADGSQVVLRNRSGQRTAVRALASQGRIVAEVDAMLEPGGEVSCDPGGIAMADLDAVYEPDRGPESLDEVRAYIEDLQVGVLFVSTADPADHGLTGLEIRTKFQGRDDPTPLVLTSEHRDGERSYVLPLTVFAADPALEFTVVAVATDGSRQEAPPVSWPVRSRGALVPVGPPVQP